LIPRNDGNEALQLQPSNCFPSLPEYWIININGRCVEVRRKPFRSRGATTRYKTLEILGPSDTVSALAAPQAKIKVADLLP
jgi:hypothetical protein